MFANNSRRNFLIVCCLFFAFCIFISSKTQEKTNKTAAEIYPYDPFILTNPLLYKIKRKTMHIAEAYPGTKTVMTQEDIENLPSSFNWFDLGVMTSVKDQKTCGSCWAHSALAVFEALIKKSDYLDVDLSEQQLINCFANGYGCWGANSFEAMLYMKTNGIVSESVYPYLNDQWPCDLTAPSEFYLEAARILPMDPFESKHERRLKTKHLILNYGPVDVFMLCYNDWWFNYRSGVYIYDGVSELRTGHGVVIVGWNDDDSIPTGGYWTVKNSFGQSWGENGYFRIAYDPEEYDVIELDVIKYCIYNGKGNDPPYFEAKDFKYFGIEGTEFSFNIGAFDPDGDPLIYSGQNLPLGMYVDPTTGTFTWNPNHTQSGSHTIIASIFDGIHTIRTGVSLEIQNKKKIKR